MLVENDIKRCGGCADGVTYIYYPKETIYYDNDRGSKSNIIYYEKPEHAPSSPPWTTFNGFLEAPLESETGRKLLKMDPNCVIKDHKVQGLWTA